MSWPSLLRASDSNYGVSDEQSVGSSLRHDSSVHKSKTLNHDALSFGWDVKLLVLRVLRNKEPSTLIEMRRGSPRCCWFVRQHIAPQQLVNHYMVLCNRSRSNNSNVVVPNTLQENTVC